MKKKSPNARILMLNPDVVIVQMLPKKEMHLRLAMVVIDEFEWEDPAFISVGYRDQGIGSCLSRSKDNAITHRRSLHASFPNSTRPKYAP